jgi:hypothetical protein
MVTLAAIRALARLRAVQFSRDVLPSLARGVSVHDVVHALENAVTCQSVGRDVVVTGPSLDGTRLRIVAKVSDVLYVCGLDVS